MGKTLLNAVSNKIGFDIDNPSEETLKQLYESINLSGTLVILEDIERTQIEITKLLGYINNLCENGHAKVLLITNENELLTTYEGTNSEGKKVRYYTDSAIAYKRIKEKLLVIYSLSLVIISNITKYKKCKSSGLSKTYRI